MSALALAVALASGLGAALRHVVDGLVVPRRGAPTDRTSPRSPLGILVVNLTGTAGLGLLVGLHAAGRLGPGPLAVLGTGLLGGYTTFSTFTWQVLEQARAGRPGRALLYVASSVGLGLAVAAATVSLTAGAGD